MGGGRGREKKGGKMRKRERKKRWAKRGISREKGELVKQDMHKINVHVFFFIQHIVPELIEILVCSWILNYHDL